MKKVDSLLEQVSVCYAAFLILTMEKNGLLTKLNTHEVKVDSNPKELEEASKKSIKFLERESLKAVRFVSKTNAIAKKIESIAMGMIDRFFETNLHSTSGVYPELLFACLLYSYFVDNQVNKKHVLFTNISNPDLYFTVFDLVENTDEVSWLSHTNTAHYMLYAGQKPIL